MIMILVVLLLIYFFVLVVGAIAIRNEVRYWRRRGRKMWRIALGMDLDKDE
jgi:hypothetical protein